MERKNFKITASLKEGYREGAKTHRIGSAEKSIASWMKDRLNAGEPVISGFLHEGKMIYPAKGGQPRAIIVEPTAVFEGELSSPEEVKRSDKKVEETLNSLALGLKEALKQESVFVSYRDRHWCV